MKTVKKSKTTRAIFREYKHSKDVVVWLLNNKIVYFYDMNIRKCYDYNSWIKENKPILYFKIDTEFIKKVEVKLDENGFYATVILDRLGNYYYITLE